MIPQPPNNAPAGTPGLPNLPTTNAAGGPPPLPTNSHHPRIPTIPDPVADARIGFHIHTATLFLAALALGSKFFFMPTEAWGSISILFTNVVLFWIVSTVAFILVGWFAYILFAKNNAVGNALTCLLLGGMTVFNTAAGTGHPLAQALDERIAQQLVSPQSANAGPWRADYQRPSPTEATVTSSNGKVVITPSDPKARRPFSHEDSIRIVADASQRVGSLTGELDNDRLTLGPKGLMNLASVTDANDMGERVARLEAFQTRAEDALGQLDKLDRELRIAYREARAPEAELSDLVDSTVKQLNLNDEKLGVEKHITFAKAGVRLLNFLKANWGSWRVDDASKRLVFKDPAAANRYSQLAQEFSTASKAQ